MNGKLTLWLTVLAAGLAAYIFFVERRAPGAVEKAARINKLLPGFDPSKVTGFEIVRTNQTIQAERFNEQWRLLNPPYPAQLTAIDSFLHALTELNRQNEISAQEIISQSGGLSPFGLDPPAAVVRIQEGTNLVQFRVGAKTLLGDRVYVQPVGASGIFATEGSLLEHLPVSANQWRNPLLMQHALVSFDHIAITAGSRGFKLERDSTNQLWRLAAPINTRADFGQVEGLVRELRSARVAQFVSDDTKADLESYGLQSPEAEVILASGTNPVFQVQFGKSPTNAPGQVYARQMTYSNIVLVSRDLAELAKKPYEDFRDRLLLNMRPRWVDRLEAEISAEQATGRPGASNEVFTVQRRTESDWQVVEPFQAAADRQLMQLFLEGLGRIEIIHVEKDVVTDFAPYGLVKPVRQYALKTSVTNSLGATNQLLVQLAFGSSPGNELDKIYCRRSDENSVYVVALPDMGRLPRAAFVLRNRRIWNFASTNVSALSISQRKQKRDLARDPVSKAWVRGDQVASAAIEETLHRLGELEAEDWVARGADQAKLLKADGSEYQLRLELGTATKLTLNVRLGPRGQPYGAVVLEQGEPVVFTFSANVYAMILQYLSIPNPPTEG